MARIFFILAHFLSFACTNYTATPTIQAPPLLVTSANNGNSNFTLLVRATNPEVIFQGYRLYTGATEASARNPGDLGAGTDCTLASGTLTVLPVQPTEYTFEIDGSASALGSGVSCRFRIVVTSGTFVSIRAIGISFRVQSGTSSLRVSGPSNALRLP